MIVISLPHAFAQSEPGVFNFKQSVVDNNGHEYFVGEIQNTDKQNNVESMIYFGSSLADSYYSQNIGIIGHDMAMPFKIDMSRVPNGKQLSLSDMRVKSFTTLSEPIDFLNVDYKSLHKDKNSGAMSGMIHNTSPLDVSNVVVIAIAMDAHAKVLDVTQSAVIDKINSNSSANFILTPIDSVSKNVSYYSCFVAGRLAENYTFTDETGKNVLFELGGDGVIKNVYYNITDHSINFDARGVFPTGGHAELMFLSEPTSLENAQSLVATINGTNYSTGIYSQEMIGAKAYRHVSVLYPFGFSTVSIQPIEQTPEYPYPAVAVAIATLAVICIPRINLLKN